MFDTYLHVPGHAYIGSEASSNYSALSWDISNSGDLTWNATVTNSSTGGAFYIVNDATLNEPTGFLGSNSTVPSNAATVGFSMFGGQVIFISGDDYLAQFWAESIGDNLWSLTWNSDGTQQTNSVPVTIKKVGPTN